MFILDHLRSLTLSIWIFTHEADGSSNDALFVDTDVSNKPKPRRTILAFIPFLAAVTSQKL